MTFELRFKSFKCIGISILAGQEWSLPDKTGLCFIEVAYIPGWTVIIANEDYELSPKCIINHVFNLKNMCLLMF